MELCSIYPSVTDLFHSACPQGPSSRFISVVVYAKISFFLWLNTVPLCVRVCVCVCVRTTFSSSVHASLDLLAVVNNAAVTMGVLIHLRNPDFNSFG